MIRTFACKETAKIFNRNYSKKLPQDMQRAAFKKLRMLSRSVNYNDLRIPPANRLEQLSGNRRGQYSIQINNQWRICFVWTGNHAEQVEIVDYH
jgi:proteic killer suppression protein